MKAIKADLQSEIVGSYDQTKTTIQGRVHQHIADGENVLSPPLNRFIDVVADTAGLVVPLASYVSSNGRIFNIGAEATGLAYLSCHTLDILTGAVTFNGTIRIALAEIATTTHTYRSLKVIDDGTTGWKIFVATTASVLISGGLFCANNVDLADFLPVGATTIPFATGSNQKAVYLLQDPANIGVNQLNVATAGLTLDRDNNLAYVHNGIAATHQFYVYSTNATLDCPKATGLVIDDATDLINHTAHPFANNDPVFLSDLSGGTGLTNNTNYFVRNVTANTYQLSATTGGAAINITAPGTVSVSRSFGTTGDAFVHKTGNLPALTGTLIILDSEDYALPQHTANAGEPCVFFPTTTTLYLGRLSELTSGATTWASLVSSNILGQVNEVTAPTVTIATWSNVLDRAIYLTNANILIMKQVINNSIDRVFAGITNTYREITTSEVVELSWVTANAIDVENGWLLVGGATIGQRGNILADLRSEDIFDYSYIVTKVLDTPSSVYKFATTTDRLYDFTGSLKIQYRTSGFGSISGGWVDIPFAEDLSAVAAADQVQFKILFSTLGLDTCIPAQITEFYLATESLFEISDNWEFSDDNSDNTSPSRIAFRLKKVYPTSVPTLYFRAHDLSDSLLMNNNSVTHSANFEYSTDSGMTWLPLGTIPNTVGTLIRYTFTTPPGVDIRPSIKES